MTIIIAANPEYLAEITSIRSEVSEEAGADADSTGTTRLYLWASAFNMWRENPVIGVGVGNYPMSLNIYRPLDGDWPPTYFGHSWWGKSTHSLYFQVLAELGSLGFLAYAYIVYCHFQNLRRPRRDRRATFSSMENPYFGEIEAYRKALVGSMVGFLAAATFLSVAYYPHLWLITGMGVALTSIMRTVASQSKNRLEITTA